MATPVGVDPAPLQRLEHRIRILQLQMDQVRTEKQRVLEREGTLRCEIQRIENEINSMLYGHLI